MCVHKGWCTLYYYEYYSYHHHHMHICGFLDGHVPCQRRTTACRLGFVYVSTTNRRQLGDNHRVYLCTCACVFVYFRQHFQHTFLSHNTYIFNICTIFAIIIWSWERCRKAQEYGCCYWNDTENILIEHTHTFGTETGGREGAHSLSDRN